MLKITTYTKQDLIELFNTDRLDNIKRSLNRLGYEYTTNGKRGNDLKLTITKTPDAFKMFCINELGVSAQSDFTLLRNFFYYFFCDEEFQQLPATQMANIMQNDNKYICRQTVVKWIEFLRNKGIIQIDNYNAVYYVSFTVGKNVYIEEITKEKYLEAWHKYWNVKKSGGSYEQARASMCKVNGGVVFKKPRIEENGFYNELIANLIDVILDSIAQDKGE